MSFTSFNDQKWWFCSWF